MPSPTQHRGATAERAAEAWLCRHGLYPLARNVRWRAGELDLIMRDGDTVVFIEVRQRASARWGGAAASIDLAKRRRLALTAQWWLSRHGAALGWPACRFDVIAIEGGELHWLRDAFTL